MPSSWGSNVKISIFGESHGPAIGVVLDGLPPGIPLDMERIGQFLARRAPGKAKFATQRKEADLPRIQSGLLNGKTTGTPLCALIENTNTRSGDYKEMEALARPSHGDYTGYLRYRGSNDVRGGGHFSGRLTAPLVFAGGVAKEILAGQGIFVGGHIASIRAIRDRLPDPVNPSREELEAAAAKDFPVLDDKQGQQMLREIEAARLEGDSVGGVVACYGLGIPPGIGSPMFGGVENVLSSLLFGIPAVRGVEFGEGFGATELRGSEHNDPMVSRNGEILSEANRHGGVLGGITSGMPLVVRVAFKPTPSIAKPQKTVNYRTGENAQLEIHGRHDPCIVPRAVPCVEACVALGLLDCMLEGGNPNGFGHPAG